MDRYDITLELDKVLELLAAETSCEDSAQLARELTPSPYLGEVRARLDDTDAACRLIASFGSPSFGGLTNVKNAARRAEAGAALSLRELTEVAKLLRVVRTVREWRLHSEGVETVLDERFSLLSSHRPLEERLTTAIVSDEQVADTASPALADIRRKIRAAQQRVRDHLSEMIRSSVYQKALQDPIVTMRDGRFVVPVRADHRSEVAGLVHDTSASGATLFVEPMAVVEANNEIRVLVSKEEAEVERIICALSAEVGACADALCADYDLLLELDLIFAKARLAYTMKATRPTLTDDRRLTLRHARHPLLDSQKAVPIDVELGGAFDTLVITGPNTGGKTVTLKTIGLITRMTACGLLPPVDDGSRVSTFDRVFADIGDEQSIEQSLSTFSAHMTNLIAILRQANDTSLVLIDELGAGTDPIEGAALATAILEQLRAQGARIAATTHYAELKAYAIHTDGVENGSCEFDVSTLRPTYRLLIGVPGRSNAFAISERLGMERALVERAQSLVSGEDRRLEDVVVRLEERRQALERELREAREARDRAVSAEAATAHRMEDMEQRRQKELEDAREQARRIVERTRRDAEAVMDELDALRKKKRTAEEAQEAKSRLRRQLERMEAEADPVTARKAEAYVLPRPLKVGDAVAVVDLGKEGTVLSLPDKTGAVEVQIGLIRMRTATDNLRLCERKAAPSPRPRAARRESGSVQSRGVRDVRTEIDLRGMMTDEGVLALDRFIDEAVLSGLSQITIIHGKGTGALRAAVQQHLRTHPNIKSYRLGTFGEGEMGVTIAEIDG